MVYTSLREGVKCVFDSTLDDLISWLMTRPPSQNYSYLGHKKCALCSYLMDHGVATPYVTVGEWGWIDAVDHADNFYMQALPPGFNNIFKGDGQYSGWNYGAALERALKVRSDNDLLVSKYQGSS